MHHDLFAKSVIFLKAEFQAFFFWDIEEETSTKNIVAESCT